MSPVPHASPPLAVLSLCLVATAGLIGCGGEHESGDAGESRDAGPAFIAVEGDFAGFTSWQSFDGGLNAADSLDGGLRTIYLNHAPPTGSTSFPLGTILVKTTVGDATFAMAKRGADFNPIIDDWEWFQLTTSATGTVQILWRGLGPSGMLGYGLASPTGCTDCHLQLGWKNDSVAGTAVSLSAF